MRLAIASLFILGLFRSSDAQVTNPEQAVHIAESWLQRLRQQEPEGVPVAELDGTGANETPVWLVTWDAVSIRLDPQNGQLVMYSSYLPNSESSNSKYSDEGAWRTAVIDEYGTALGLAQFEECRVVDRGPYIPGHEDSSGKVAFSFSPRPYGYSSYGAGNGMSIELDRGNGQLKWILAKRGRTYDRPNVVLDANAAVIRAKEIFNAEIQFLSNKKSHLLVNDDWPGDEIARTILMSNLRYVTPGKGFSSTVGDSLRKAKRVRLAYVLSTERFALMVDAETGESLGGGITTAIGKDGSRVSADAVSSGAGSDFTPLLLCIGFGSLGILVLRSRAKRIHSS